MKKNILIFLNFLFLTDLIANQKLALVIEPVADLISQHSKLKDLSNISLSPVNKKDSHSCARLHQALFNEIVNVISFENETVVIETSNAFYQTLEGDNKENKFKTHKNNLILLSQLKKNNIDLSKRPKPINFNTKNECFKNTITLTSYYYYEKNNSLYSAGTRFKFKEENDKFYVCYLYDNKLKKIITIDIPKSICIDNNQLDTKEKQVSYFLKLLKEWANTKENFIPYVWGGCSFTQLYSGDFQQIIVQGKKRTLEFYENKKFNDNPKPGFDCSGLIFRAAQIVGMPFYFKNSTTILKNLRELNKDEIIENGDIIWIPGHVMVISDVKRNLFIEATDYSTGYGKVQQIGLKRVFKNINNYQVLKNYFLNKREIIRLDKTGKIYQKTNKLKILKLKSIYENNEKNID